MTYRSEPTRWTQSPEDAPELLQSALAAATREGPSDLQMRALTLKLAALGAGTAVAAGAAGAQASATGAGAASGLAGAAGSGLAGAAGSGGGLGVLAKVAVSLALVGAAATGGVYYKQSTLQRQAAGEQHLARSAQASRTQAAEAEELPVDPAANTNLPAPAAAPTAPTVTHEGAPSARAAELGTALIVEQLAPSAAEPTTAEPRAIVRANSRERSAGERISERSRRSGDKAGSDRPQRSARSAASEATPAMRAAEPAQAQEIDLLRSARAALAGRPQEAYRLTEQHRALYPTGVFAQEREALAIEALLRAGNLTLARELADGFVKRYPSSPHTHRFLETMKLD
jgi:hypothetical protein